jgi:hypothetical protein
MQTLARAKTIDVRISFSPLDHHHPECLSDGEHELVTFTARCDREATETAPYCLLYSMEDAAESAIRQAITDFYPDDETVRDAAVGLAAAADHGRTGVRSVSVMERD